MPHTEDQARTVQLIDARPPQVVPAMSNSVDRHDRVRLTSRWIEVDGAPVTAGDRASCTSAASRGTRWEETLR